MGASKNPTHHPMDIAWVALLASQGGVAKVCDDSTEAVITRAGGDYWADGARMAAEDSIRLLTRDGKIEQATTRSGTVLAALHPVHGWNLAHEMGLD